MIFQNLFVIIIPIRLVLVKFLNDTCVQPPDTQWFQFYTPNQAKEIQAFSESNAAVSTKYSMIHWYSWQVKNPSELLFSFNTEKFGPEWFSSSE